MTRRQRLRSQARAESVARLDMFAGRPVELSRYHVDALLNELCGRFGICLRPQDYEAVEASSPHDPRAFAELVCALEGVGTEDDEFFESVLICVLETFEGVAATHERGPSYDREQGDEVEGRPDPS